MFEKIKYLFIISGLKIQNDNLGANWDPPSWDTFNYRKAIKIQQAGSQSQSFERQPRAIRFISYMRPFFQDWEMWLFFFFPNAQKLTQSKKKKKRRNRGICF